jgi:hypothetical protein
MCGLGAVDDDNWNGLLSSRVPASIRPMVAIDLGTAGSRYLQTDTQSDGTIGSRLAMGSEAIRNLMEQTVQQPARTNERPIAVA